jgi:hypothetical protein
VPLLCFCAEGIPVYSTYSAAIVVRLLDMLGRSIAENEEISMRATTTPSVHEWLRAFWKSAQEAGFDQLSVEEIDREIAAARKARREHQRSEQ